METNTYISDLAIHPGEYLEEVLEDIGMSQAELSNRVGRPTQAINEIIKGKKSITPTTAIELEIDKYEFYLFVFAIKIIDFIKTSLFSKI